MPGTLTEVTELSTALGMLVEELARGVAQRPSRLLHVSDQAWEHFAAGYYAGDHRAMFETAFQNGLSFLRAEDGLRNRPPKVVEWKGPHRPPGDDVVPADLRIDHVYQVSCKYLSRIMQNPGPARLFDRLLVGEARTNTSWFESVAPTEYQAFYAAARAAVPLELPMSLEDVTIEQRHLLRDALRSRQLPSSMQAPWVDLCRAVSIGSSDRWNARLQSDRDRLRLLWRLLRIGDAPYFVLGSDGMHHMRLRVASAWDWIQAYELRSFTVEPRPAGQPEVAWTADVRSRATSAVSTIAGHVEVRWSHGRFNGSPEAKVYLDTPLSETPGYFPLE